MYNSNYDFEYRTWGLPSSIDCVLNEYLGRPFRPGRGFDTRSERLAHRNKMIKRRSRRKMAKQSRKKNR